MNDPYLYESSSVLRNLLNIHDEKELNLAEAELSRANMMLLYEQGFEDFSTRGIQKFIRFCLAKYMIGPDNSVKSISGKASRFWWEKVSGTLMMRTLSGIWRGLGKNRLCSMGKSVSKGFCGTSCKNFSGDLANASVPRGQHPYSRHDDNIFCGALRILFRPGVDVCQRGLCTPSFCSGQPV